MALTIDVHFYDFVALANNSDLLFVMVYDTRSQIYGRCVASANSPLSLSQLGIQQYLDLGIPASKLVLGLPWYGKFKLACRPMVFQRGLSARTNESREQAP